MIDDPNTPTGSPAGAWAIALARGCLTGRVSEHPCAEEAVEWCTPDQDNLHHHGGRNEA